MALRALTFTALALGLGAAFTSHSAASRAAQAEADFPPVGAFVEVTGGRVHYVQEGEGPDLILLHGAGGNLREFTFDLMDRLSDRYRVTAFDRPGLGYTDRAPGTPTGLTETEAESPAMQAAMLREAADTLGISRPIIAGHSFGGIVAMAWATEDLDLDASTRAAAIVSIAGVLMPWPGDLGPYYRINGSVFGGTVTVPLIAAYAPEDRIRSSIEGIFAPQPVPEGYQAHAGAPLTLRPESFRANVRQVNTLRPHVVEMAARYPELTLPIEIVHGTADTSVPIHVHPEELIKVVDPARLTPLEGVGHMPHQTNPQEVVDAIDRAATRAGLR